MATTAIKEVTFVGSDAHVEKSGHFLRFPKWQATSSKASSRQKVRSSPVIGLKSGRPLIIQIFYFSELHLPQAQRHFHHFPANCPSSLLPLFVLSCAMRKVNSSIPHFCAEIRLQYAVLCIMAGAVCTERNLPQF